jgi:hypothetical protein
MTSAGQTRETHIPQILIKCYSPFQRLAIVTPDPDDEALHDAPYAPFPTAASFQALDWGRGWIVYASTPRLELDRPVACAQPTFEARGLRLREFRMPGAHENAMR